MHSLHFSALLDPRVLTSSIFILFLFGPILAQDKWCYTRCDGDIGPLETYYMDELCGDTIIDGLEYKKLISTQYNVPELDIKTQFTRGYIRNSNDSIFYKKDQESEILLYNYNMQIGDLFRSSEINFIDTIFIFNEPKRRYFWGSNSPTDTWPTFVLEDIGIINYYNNYTWSDDIFTWSTYFFNSYYNAEQKKLFKIDEILPSPYDCHYNNIEKMCSGYTSNCASLFTEWYAVPDFDSIFRLETRAIPFSAKIIFGNPEHACDLELSISVTNSEDQLVHFQSIAIDLTDTIQTLIFPETYTPACTHADIYNFKYELTNLAEMVTEDIKEFQIELTDHFTLPSGNTDEVPLSSIISLEEGATAISFIYYNELDDLRLLQMNLGLADVNQFSSGFIHFQILELEQAVGEEISPSERDLIGVATMIVDTLQNRSNFTVDLFQVTQSGDPIPGTVIDLKPQTNYLITMLVEPLSASGPTFDFYVKPPTRRTCEANVFAHHELSLENQYGYYTAPMTGGTPAEFESITLESNCKFQISTELLITPNHHPTFDCMPSLIQEQNTTLANIYPNPLANHQELIIKNEKSEIEKISIYDINGDIVYLDKKLQYEKLIKLDLNALTAGIYFLYLKNPSGIQTEKLIITD